MLGVTEGVGVAVNTTETVWLGVAASDGVPAELDDDIVWLVEACCVGESA